MSRKKIYSLIITTFLLAIVLISFLPTNSELSSLDNKKIEYPHSSASLEGSENIIITNLNREANLSGYGLVNIDDTLTVNNLNSNPITAVFIGVENPDELIFFEALTSDRNTLFAERSHLKMNNYEMIAIYFDSPLLPQQTKTIKFIQSYNNQLLYGLYEQSPGEYIQRIFYEEFIYPLLPYKVDGEFYAVYRVPETSTLVSQEWGVPGLETATIEFKKADSGVFFLTPFLENLESGGNAKVKIELDDNVVSRLEAHDLTREIFISPWGVIKVTEQVTIKNTGGKPIYGFSIRIPGPARRVVASDYLGEILGTSLDPAFNYTNLKYKNFDIDLSVNRVRILPNSKFTFSYEYFLPWEKFVTLNWLQESVNLNILTSSYDFFCKSEVTKIIIDGCYRVESITDDPDAIDNIAGGVVLTYNFENISPFEEIYLQFTFTIDMFDLFLRPIVFILLISLISSFFVILVKSKKQLDTSAVVQKELLPISEIREFCSLYEEKTALALEIREAEENAKKKKIAKKKFQNILKNNSAKIDEIEKEIIPFKKIVRETNATFNGIVEKLELLEAERISVKDSLNLLETRYKQGKLPSRASYFKLTDDFLKRRRRIDRRIDRYIQELRSYLL
jgi:hypothetical protein